MLGPANPNAAIASMFGTPKGFPPIWKRTKIDGDTRLSVINRLRLSTTVQKFSPV